MLISMIIVARILGKVSFGELALVQATLGVAGLMAGLGLGSAATRFVAHYVNTDPGRAGRVIALVTILTSGTILISVGFLVLGSGFISEVVMKAPQLEAALIWGALLMASQVLRGVQGSILIGLERFDTNARLIIIEGIVSLISMVALAKVMGVEGALLGLAVGAIAAWCYGIILQSREYIQRQIKINYLRCMSEWREVIGFSIPSFLSHTVATPALWMAITMLARTDNGLAELGLYQAAYQWHGPLIFLPMIFMSASIPVLVQEWESGDRLRFKRLVIVIFSTMLVFSLPPALLGAVVSPWIMQLYGPGFREGWLVLALLLLAAPFHGVAKVAFGVLSAMNRPWWIMSVNLLWATVFILTSMFLIQIWGAMGLATAFLGAYVVLCFSSITCVLFGTNQSLRKEQIQTVVIDESSEISSNYYS
jgi:O-antigen/teichoic acid export membrane protein